MAIRFEEERRSRRWAARLAACAAMNLDEGDYIVGAEIVDEDDLILSISENGFGKRTKLAEYRLTARGGKGVINMKTTPKTGKVVRCSR